MRDAFVTEEITFGLLTLRGIAAPSFDGAAPHCSGDVEWDARGWGSQNVAAEQLEEVVGSPVVGSRCFRNRSQQFKTV